MEAHMQRHKEQGDLDSLIDYPAPILCEETILGDVTNELQEMFQARAYSDADKIISTFDDDFEGVPNEEGKLCGWDLHAKDYIVSAEVVGTDMSSNNNKEPTKNNKGLDQPLLARPAFSRKALSGSGLASPESVKSTTLAYNQSYIGMTLMKFPNSRL